MAISDNLSIWIMSAVKQFNLGGRALMLGRQRWAPGQRRMTRIYVRDYLKENYPHLNAADLASEDGYSEKFFQKMGFESVDSLDISDFESASVIANLGEEIPRELHAQFDYIYDGGTIEHVFELPTAMRNVDKMLAPGGVFQAHSPSNNFLNHGFVQISPEMVFGFWIQAMGYELLETNFIPLKPKYIGQSVEFTNPLITGHRPRMLGKVWSDSAVILNYVVRKPTTSQIGEAKVLQSDYVLRWKDNEEGEA